MLIPIIKLYLSIFLVLFIPGFFFMLAILGRFQNRFSALEKLVISFGLSLTATNFLVMLMDFGSIPITGKWILMVILLFSALCWGVYKLRTRENGSRIPPKSGHGKSGMTPKEDYFSSLRHFSYRQILIFILILLFAVAIRGFYVSRGIMPQTTDMGHHMYWSSYITTNGTLPDYDGQPDFIIGEHIVFASVAALTKIPFVSAMPVVTLFLINIFSLLAIFILAYRLSEYFTKKRTAKNIAFFVLLITGTFYAISSPGAKFVSGGVIGNIIGNFFIPFVIYLFVTTLKFKSRNLAMAFILAVATMVYTHHLSSYIFLYALVGFLVVLLVALLIYYRFNLKKFFSALLVYAKPFFAFRNMILVILLILFFFFVREPSYLNPEAIDTAVGTPVKATRTGLTIGAVILSAGPWRFLYGMIGLAVIALVMLFVFKKSGKDGNEKKNILILASLGFLLAWTVMIILMSVKPTFLKVDIPSNRIVSYITYPMSILAAISVVLIFALSARRLSKALAILVGLVIFGTGFISGFSDISDSARDHDPRKNQEVFQTYLASMYLADRTTKDEQVLKDHTHLAGDSWIKIFFMRGYKYPLSRTFDKRYDDIYKKRETCTRDMVIQPDTERGVQCYDETGVKYIMLKKGYDNAQFDNSNNFSKVYASTNTVIYKRN